MPEMTLTKADLVDKLYESTDWTHQQAKQRIEDLLKLIKDGLNQDRELLISGFGKFEVKSKHARKGRNPATDKAMMLDGREVVTFSWSRKFRDELNGGDA